MSGIGDAGQQKVVVPDTTSALSKKEQVATMFNNIAGRYDLLNHLLSMGIDRSWRKKAIAEAAAIQPGKILDIATGTGDMAIAAANKMPGVNVTGMDIAVQMLAEGKKKIASLGLRDRIAMLPGDSEALPFPDAAFDVVMCAYGVRNFENLSRGLEEMSRVLRPGGKVVILEFSKPERTPIRQLYNFYFRHVLPTVGKLVSGHKAAYTYLPESVSVFPDGEKFCSLLSRCGFDNPRAQPLTFGITTLYTASKK